MLDLILVEDSADDAVMIVRQLERSQMAVDARIVADRAEFAAALRRRPDVVISDFRIPAFGGLEALEMTRALYPDLPFVLISGAVGEEHAVEALKAGADESS